MERTRHIKLKRKESDVLGTPKSLVIWVSHPTILSLMSILMRDIHRRKAFKSEKEEFLGKPKSLVILASRPSICKVVRSS